MDSQPKPFVALIINGHIREVECSVCRDRIAHWDGTESAEEQQTKLQDAFARHLRLEHEYRKVEASPVLYSIRYKLR